MGGCSSGLRCCGGSLDAEERERIVPEDSENGEIAFSLKNQPFEKLPENQIGITVEGANLSNAPVVQNKEAEVSYKLDSENVEIPEHNEPVKNVNEVSEDKIKIEKVEGVCLQEENKNLNTLEMSTGMLSCTETGPEPSNKTQHEAGINDEEKQQPKDEELAQDLTDTNSKLKVENDDADVTEGETGTFSSREGKCIEQDKLKSDTLLAVKKEDENPEDLREAGTVGLSDQDNRNELHKNSTDGSTDGSVLLRDGEKEGNIGPDEDATLLEKVPPAVLSENVKEKGHPGLDTENLPGYVFGKESVEVDVDADKKEEEKNIKTEEAPKNEGEEKVKSADDGLHKYSEERVPSDNSSNTQTTKPEVVKPAIITCLKRGSEVVDSSEKAQPKLLLDDDKEGENKQVFSPPIQSNVGREENESADFSAVSDFWNRRQ